MTQDAHERARCLINAGCVDEVSPQEVDWLSLHLESCASCAQYAATTNRVIQGLRSIQVDPHKSLVSRTQLRVRLRAHEIQEQADHARPVWVSCAVSLAMTAVSTSYLWEASGWLAHQVGGPNWLWQLWAFTFWFFPSVAAIAVLVWQRPPLTQNAEVR
jgi:hypothetical protein